MSITARIARLNSNGSTDTSFDPGDGLNAEGLCVCALPSGQYLAGGSFSEVRGTPKTRLAVLNDDGSLDSFGLAANGVPRFLIPQNNGRVIIGGSFNALGGITRNRFARLKDDLTLEPAFDTNLNGDVLAGAVQEDGKIFVVGSFSEAGGLTRNRLAQLHNDEADHSLTVDSVSTVTWRRTGSGPETQRVTFEISTDSGASWSSIGGTVERTADGWQVTGLTLTDDGLIRARAYPSDARSNGILEDQVAFDVIPVIQVDNAGTVLVSGASTIAFDPLQTGKVQQIALTVSNIGLDTLTLDATPAVLSGTNSDQWTIVDQPDSPIAPGSSSILILSFSPTSEGSKTATVSIVSDDADTPFTVALTGLATPGPGARDTTWQPVPNGAVVSLACRSGETVVTGAFNTMNTSTRKGWAQIAANGSLLTQTGTGANNTVVCSAILPNGQILLGGSFTFMNGTPRGHLARVNSDGSLDTTWNRAVIGTVNAFAMQDDGGVIVAGNFTRIGGVVRSNLARIAPDGTVDAAWNPQTDGEVDAVAIQTDGKIVVGGAFLTVAGTARKRLARLNANGSLDATFSFTTTAPSINAIAIQTDGNILIAEDLGGVKRLLTTGAADSAWASNSIRCASILPQADGYILVSSTSNSIANSLVRLDSEGNEDTTWNSVATRQIQALTGQADGSVIVGGDFRLNATAYKLAKLINGEATSALSIVNETFIQWLRGGTVPETQQVTFDLSQDNGATWTRLGSGTRIPGGWTVSGISLPISGRIRARARIAGGSGNGSSGILEEILPYSGLNVPDLNVENSSLTIADGGTLQFTGMIPGQTTDVTLTLRNTGNQPLTSIVVTSDSTDFQVISLGLTSLASGQSTTVVIRFAPAAVGSRTGTLTISSNVPGAKNPYSVMMTGSGITLPTATTNTEQNLTSTSAKLRGTVKANHDTAKTYFEYRRSVDSTWTKAPVIEMTVTGFAATLVTYDVGSLTPNTDYVYRVVIYNSVNTSADPKFGANRAFTTPA